MNVAFHYGLNRVSPFFKHAQHASVVYENATGKALDIAGLGDLESDAASVVFSDAASSGVHWLIEAFTPLQNAR